jgi:hypothetical protein
MSFVKLEKNPQTILQGSVVFKNCYMYILYINTCFPSQFEFRIVKANFGVTKWIYGSLQMVFNQQQSAAKLVVRWLSSCWPGAFFYFFKPAELSKKCFRHELNYVLLQDVQFFRK